MSSEYQELKEILVRVETNLNHFVARSEDHEQRIRHLEKAEEVEARLTALEKWKYRLPAAAVTALILSLASVVGSFIVPM